MVFSSFSLIMDSSLENRNLPLIHKYVVNNFKKHFVNQIFHTMLWHLTKQ